MPETQRDSLVPLVPSVVSVPSAPSPDPHTTLFAFQEHLLLQPQPKNYTDPAFIATLDHYAQLLRDAYSQTVRNSAATDGSEKRRGKQLASADRIDSITIRIAKRRIRHQAELHREDLRFNRHRTIAHNAALRHRKHEATLARLDLQLAALSAHDESLAPPAITLDESLAVSPPLLSITEPTNSPSLSRTQCGSIGPGLPPPHNTLSDAPIPPSAPKDTSATSAANTIDAIREAVSRDQHESIPCDIAHTSDSPDTSPTDLLNPDP